MLFGGLIGGLLIIGPRYSFIYYTWYDMPLTDRAIKAAKAKDKDYKLAHEKGMYLLVTKAGSKLFKLKYRVHGIEKKLSIGSYPQISLKQAQEQADIARHQVNEGKDPSALKVAAKELDKLNNDHTFKGIALEWFDVHTPTLGKSATSRHKNLLVNHLFPALGALPITDITPPLMLGALKTIESKGSFNTTKRARQTASAVFGFAIASDRAVVDPTLHLRPALAKQPKVKHRAAITTPLELGLLLVDIDKYSGTIITRTALKLSTLFFCRPVDIRSLKWSDINREDNRIEIQASKTYLDFIIPLSKQAITLLNELERHTGTSQYIFPSEGTKHPIMSENTVNDALKRMGYKDKMTAHGFRATGRTLLDEVLEYKIEWIEQQLAHTVKDFNGTAYNRTKHLKQRTEMMQRWADYLDELRSQALA